MFTDTQLRKLIFPLMVEQVLVMLVGMLDTVMVSSAGEAAISGVSIVNEVNWLVIAVMDALAAGGSVVTSQYLGYGRREETDLSASQLIMISILIPLILGAVCFFSARNILTLLYARISPEVMDAGVTYFRITALSFPFLGMYNSCCALYRSMSRTKSIMNTSILMNVINVAGNYFGVYVLHLGVAGVAWPTLVSRAVAAMIMFRLCFDPENELCIRWKQIFMADRPTLRRIMSMAVPNAVESGLFQMGRIIVTIFVSTYGTSEIAANAVANGLGNLCYIADNALGLAIMTAVGQCVGAGRYEEAEFYGRKLVKIAWVAEILECVLCWISLPLLMQMYEMTPETAAIVQRIMILCFAATALLHAPAFVLPNAIRAAGDARFTMAVGVGSMFCVRIVGAYLFGTVLGLKTQGIWIAMYCDWIVRICFFCARWRSGKWKNFRVVGK
ncbi:MATE family efflux transporter [Erysipelotrichaceae bacterium Oil+RF-744-GAM-WT-6]|uniref:Probable multidrug resistance protein NorM n=1 Tax=Stecheria intestinalis TaxID=2606630 RepID=A0A7X2TFN7_9FIRM|nr:MATE family efflux transporter [Stecheria intestinalis]MSS58939.1 MATE family efflux transporter [Stecheria intestinalis]